MCFQLYVRILLAGSPPWAISELHLRVEIQGLQSLTETFRVKAGFGTCLLTRVSAFTYFGGSEKSLPFVQAQ